MNNFERILTIGIVFYLQKILRFSYYNCESKKDL